MSDGVDPAELWERYLEEIRADRGTPSPQGAMAFAVDALTTLPAAAQSNGDAGDLAVFDDLGKLERVLVECASLRAQLEAARKALEFITDGYENQDVSHVDYRVKVYQAALAALETK